MQECWGERKKICVIVSICNKEMFTLWWHLSYMNVCWKFLFFKEWRMIWITAHLLNMLLHGVHNLKINEQVGDLTMTIWKNIKLTMSSCSCFTGYQEPMLGIFTQSNPENTYPVKSREHWLIVIWMTIVWPLILVMKAYKGYEDTGLEGCLLHDSLS